MKKMLLVLCVVLIGSMLASAKAKTYTVTLNDFCDIWTLTLDKGNTSAGSLAPQIYVWGNHDLLSRCGLANYDTIGQKHGANAKVPPNDAFGTSQALLDIQDTENAPSPVEFTLRVTSGCAAAAFAGGASFGGNFELAEDGCAVGPAPTRTGLKPMVAIR